MDLHYSRICYSGVQLYIHFGTRLGMYYNNYSLNDNIVRGAAKSLATLPTAWMDNITETTEVLALSLSQYYSRHRGVFQISSSF